MFLEETMDSIIIIIINNTTLDVTQLLLMKDYEVLTLEIYW